MKRSITEDYFNITRDPDQPVMTRADYDIHQDQLRSRALAKARMIAKAIAEGKIIPCMDDGKLHQIH